VPVLLERRLRDADALHDGPSRRLRDMLAVDPRRLEIGLVNNMSDAGLASAEEQFLGLIGAAATDDLSVRVQIWSIPDIPRGEGGRGHVAARHVPFHRVWDSRLDGLIVTGAEPREADLRDEPFWPALTRLFDWVAASGVSSVYSCLASHAAALHTEGIRRRPLAAKRSGVFRFERRTRHPLFAGAPSEFEMPHSRWNDLPEKALRDRGFAILSRSDAAGVDVFAGGPDGRNLYFQGHPEYCAASLPREYRRDVGRWLRGERDDYPDTPANCFDGEALAALDRFRETAWRRRAPGTLAEFPADIAAAGARDTWRPVAVRLFRNWLDLMSARKARGARGAPAETLFPPPQRMAAI
jgi:homoserine O-succinyltransferase